MSICTCGPELCTCPPASWDVEEEFRPFVTAESLRAVGRSAQRAMDHFAEALTKAFDFQKVMSHRDLQDFYTPRPTPKWDQSGADPVGDIQAFAERMKNAKPVVLPEPAKFTPVLPSTPDGSVTPRERALAAQFYVNPDGTTVRVNEPRREDAPQSPEDQRVIPWHTPGSSGVVWHSRASQGYSR